MQGFRSEIENPLVQKDIIELERKIKLFRDGKLDEEKFRSLRLARGVYGQRQQGVQMIRIKLPYGKVTVPQLLRIADVSDEYSTGNLHLTTRQDIQIHFVSLDRTPELWAELERDQITLREACGNTVRNITGSATAGIDPDEPFDVSPYAHAMFEFFLRNPICQEMGRKIKIAFSSSEKDTALVYMHDLGFIPKTKREDGKDIRGFKVYLGGGLGAQPFLAHLSHEFLPEDQLLPFTEAVLRVFDRHGERNSRHKARLKFLLAKLGLENFLQLVEQERLSLPHANIPVKYESEPTPMVPKSDKTVLDLHKELLTDSDYLFWKRTNVFEQKQPGFFGVYLKVQNGNIRTPEARKLAHLIKQFSGSELRLTINQGALIKFVPEENLPALYAGLKPLGLVDPGFDTIADITSCPGTDTCNLGISNSTNIARELESIIQKEYANLITDATIRIKISGCMNGCGQHSIANIGFHGSSIKTPKGVAPALQLLLGGGTTGDGTGRVADKVLKIPSKRAPLVLRTILDDYQANALDGEYFNDFYDRLGEKYFYALLKPLTDLTTLQDTDYIDWGQEAGYSTEIGVGECAGVVIDLVSTLLFEAEEKLDWAKSSLEQKRWSDSIYQSYSALVSGAKALLLEKGIACNTHEGILNDFDKLVPGFKEKVLQINKNQPEVNFASNYYQTAFQFLSESEQFREKFNQ